MADSISIEKIPSSYYKNLRNIENIKLMTFKYFHENSMKMKNFTVRDLFLRQLIQLKGLSIDKAMAIIEQYPTPRHLINQYQQCRDKCEAENLLSSIQFGTLRKSIGAIISKIIHEFYNL